MPCYSKILHNFKQEERLYGLQGDADGMTDNPRPNATQLEISERLSSTSCNTPSVKTSASAPDDLFSRRSRPPTKGRNPAENSSTVPYGAQSNIQDWEGPAPPTSASVQTRRSPSRSAQAETTAASILSNVKTADLVLPDYGGVARSRDGVLLMRTELDLQRETSENYRRYLQESQEAFMKVVSGEPKLSTFRTMLEPFYRQMAEDNDRYCRQLEATRALERKLSSKEVSLGKREGFFVERTQRLLCRYNPSVMSQLDLNSETESQSTNSATEIPDIVAEYFDKAGDTKLAQERLDTVVKTYQRAEVKRQLQHDQGTVPSQSDQQVEQRLQLLHAEKLEELSIVKAATARFKAQCHEQGFDPDDFRRRLLTKSEDERSHLERLMPLPRATDRDLTPVVDDVLTPTLPRILEQHGLEPSSYRVSPAPNPQEAPDRVSHWLQNVSGGDDSHAKDGPSDEE